MAKFYKGFVYEQDVNGRLTVEGNAVPDGDELDVDERAKKHIDNSADLVKREAERAIHLTILRRGAEDWNQWRRQHPEIHPMLTFHDFSRHVPHTSLDGYDFSYTNFTQATLKGLSLRGANFHQAILAKADLSGAHLEEANFCRTDFYETNLEGAWLTGANLQGVQLARTMLRDADLSECKIYGLSAWDLDLKGATQTGLHIHFEQVVGGQRRQQVATVNGIDVASFMYYTLTNKNIARVIDATKSQWVLLLGRFTEGYNRVLEELAAGLKDRNYIPIIFDFEPARAVDLIETIIETIILLAGLSRMVIVDITDPKSTPLELYAVVPQFAVPVVPIIRKGDSAFGVFPGFFKFPWVHRPPIEYDRPGELDLDFMLRLQFPAVEVPVGTPQVQS